MAGKPANKLERGDSHTRESSAAGRMPPAAVPWVGIVYRPRERAACASTSATAFCRRGGERAWWGRMFEALANTAPPSSDPMVWLILGLVSLIPITNGILSIIRFFKADPPPSSYALNADVDRKLENLEARIYARLSGELSHLSKSHDDLKKDLAEFSKSMVAEMKQINRALGKLEGGED